MFKRSITIYVDMVDAFTLGFAINFLNGAVKQLKLFNMSDFDSWIKKYEPYYKKYEEKCKEQGGDIRNNKFGYPLEQIVDTFANETKIKTEALCENFEEYAVTALAELDLCQYNEAGVAYFEKWNEKHGNFISAAKFISESTYENISDKVISAKAVAVNLENKVNATNRAIQDAIEEIARRRKFIADMIQPVEKRYLDQQQIDSIVCDEDNQLVLAGAGTGKTTTIVGKVKYLLKTGKCNPKEMLLLSFTNKSAAEMKQRVNSETGYDLDVMTFHKLGMDIIAKVNGKRPTVYSKPTGEFARLNINKYCNDDSFRKNLLIYFFFSPSKAITPFDVKSQQEYEEYIETNPPITIKQETVKGYCEMEIANFLYRNGVNYTYEPLYMVDTADEEYSGYHPDFLLDDYGIYIEFFAVNKEGNVPSYFTAKHGGTAQSEYLSGIKWKRKTHKAHNTVLVEMYYADKQDNLLTERLQERLEKYGVQFNPKSDTELWNEVNKDNSKLLGAVTDVIGTVITLAKSNGYDYNQLAQANNSLRNIPLLNLVKPIFEDYNKMLSDTGMIDFSDMISQATEYIRQGCYSHNYSYVIVDEYQDISKVRYQLLNAMRINHYYKLFCVGDDWQSIYRFAGSDIGYILNFERYWGNTVMSKIETTYRFSQNLIAISGNFVMQNNNQTKKELKSVTTDSSFPLGLIEAYNDKYLVQFMAEKIMKLEKNSTVFFIGRYNYDKDFFKESDFEVSYNNEKTKYDVKYRPRPDLTMEFLTVHKSKGLQADYVFIVNNKKKGMGFPSRIQDDPLIQLLLDGSDNYPFAEERRLFYVAMTRAKKKVWLLVQKNNISIFATELINKYNGYIKMERYAERQRQYKESMTCPLCNGRLVRRKGSRGEFIGCSNFSKLGCKYTRSINTEV